MPLDFDKALRGAARTAAAAAIFLGACAQVPPVAEAPPAAPVVFPQPPDEPRFYYERTIRGSSDVVPEAGAEHFRRMLTGELRAGENLSKPYAVAVHRGRIYVSDSVQRFIKVFDIPRGRYERIGVDEPGRLIKPLGIAVDRSGVLYVADASAKAILAYAPDGKFLRKIGGPQWFDRLASVSVDPRGDRLYVVDVGGVQSEQHRVRVFEAGSGRHVMDIGKRGSGPGEFNFPRDLAVGRSGELYVVDGGNFRVQVFDHDGKYLRSFGGVGRQFGNFSRPKEIAADTEGNLYVVDTGFGNFQIFDPEGHLLLFIGERSERDGPARYMLPSGIAVDEDGRVYMVDQWFRKVDVFRPARLRAGEGYLAGRARADHR